MKDPKICEICGKEIKGVFFAEIDKKGVAHYCHFDYWMKEGEKLND